jgi:hypothetical protein
MATLYKDNIPYTDDNAAVETYAAAEVLVAVTSAVIANTAGSTYSLTINGSLVGEYDGAPTAMTVLYAAYIANGGAAWEAFSITTPALDMSSMTMSSTTMTIAGHVWEDYSGAPRVVCLDANNAILSDVTPTGTGVVTITNGTDRIWIGGAGASPTIPLLITPFVFVVDRRPIFQAGYATQTYSSTGDIKYGVNNVNYRKTPATGATMTNTATNGKLAWLTDKVKPAADEGFERFHLTNIAGWTSFSDQGNDQPHFPSNSYTGLALTSVDVYINQNDTTGAITQATPFTNDGLSTGATIGDNKEAWAAGVTALKSWVTGTPEVTSYQGYRPCYGELAMTTLKKDILGYSKASTNAAGWTGTGNSPGFTPEPGYDGAAGFSSSTAAFAAWFDEEIAGLKTLGFDGIGLDTGTRVFDNSGGRANGTELGTTNPDGLVGDDRLTTYFNDQGLKPVFESVGLDTWTHGGGKSAAPATDGRYADAAYWGYFGSWWGYEGLVNGEEVVTAHYDKAGGSVESPSGGYFFDTNLCGNAANAAAFGAEAEVHVIFQWGTGTYMTRIMQGTAGDAASGNGVGWLGMRQIMWDIHDAGAIVSFAGSMSTTIDGITPATAAAFVLSLYTNPTQARPTV